MSIKAIIWDLGGVLVRTEDLSPREKQAKRLGTTRLALEKLVFRSDSGLRCQLGEISLEQHWENVRQSLNLTSEELEQFQADFWAGDQMDWSLVEFIRSLHSRYKTGLLSNHFPDLRSHLSEDWKIEDAFDAIVISSEVGLLKPDPEIYYLALQRLEVKPGESVFIDDFEHNIAGAEAFGIHTIQFRSPDQICVDLSQLLKENV